jgi:hypothetical protein
MLPILVAVRTRAPELDLAYRQIVAERRSKSVEVVRRGIARGDFRPDVDVDVVVDSFVSGLFYRFLVTNAPLDEAFRVAVVDGALRAFGVPESVVEVPDES